MAETPAERTRRMPAAPHRPARNDGARPGNDRRGADAEPTVPSVPAAPPAPPTRALPHAEATQQLPASHTESIPQSHPDRPTRAIRQVRQRAVDGAWPAIPMLPVIRPDDEPLSEADRIRDQRGVRALREHLDRRQDGDGTAPAWPDREDPPGTLYPPER